MEKIKIGYSPCPNDTFIFDALVHGKIDTEGLEFEVHHADVEELNRLAFAGELPICKLSYHAFAHLWKDYQLLRAGSALGNNCGPLLVGARSFGAEEVAGAKIAIPGQHTTANFLLSFAFPGAQNRQEYLFSDIEAAVLAGEIDLGLLIHENRFTYAQRGLHKVMDLGQYWEERTGLPIPLGGIAVRRDLPEELKQKLGRLLRKSVEYAFAHPRASVEYVAEHAQEMDAEVCQLHINLYVTENSIDFGPKGEAAIAQLMQSLDIQADLPLWVVI
ncbi:putative periplasmic solute-binding protein [Saprospira grandis DSM 2844]|uniref:1,4-dihydroxy-6-naphtoate synthase n=1 Tax=Saprospira grandis DSM 2844 TaxID=694433 RepID=J1I642_9BACT|nr:1,4-dihydroxy-6-naphthoate synthase [Saprospira grandis]EJF54230.1 putative periplasmic solute-binding protein [Saprospira grandis DSM 2844]